jgi:hypothetical protein
MFNLKPPRHISTLPNTGHLPEQLACPRSADFVAEVGDERSWILDRLFFEVVGF